MHHRSTIHPLQETFTRIQQLSPYVGARLEAPMATDWLAPAELFAPPATHLTMLIAATQKRLRTTAVNKIGSALIQEYQWPLIASAVACFLVDRRVPALDPDHVRRHLPLTEQEEAADAAHPPRVAYLSGRFAALPDDPAANHADATIVPCRDALRDQLRSELEAHFGWVIERLSAAVGCNQRGLWLCVTDRVAGTLSWLMQEQDKESCLACINREADGLIRVAGTPLFHKKVGFFELTYQEQRQVYLDRATCCYWYKTDGGDYCTTCPHRTKEDRNTRLLASMAAAYEKAVCSAVG